MLIAAAMMAAVPHICASEHFTQRFGGDPFNKRILKYVGERRAPDAFTETDRGLLIKFPGDKQVPPQLGVATIFKVAGDFEITAEYDLVEVEHPEKGYGAGVVLRLYKPGGHYSRTHFSHFKKRAGKNAFTANVWSNTNGGVKQDAKEYPAETDRGQIRLVRSGSTLTYLVADAGGEEFREVRTVDDFGTEPLNAVELLGDTGGCEQPFTVQLTRLSIRADDLPFGLPERQRQTIWGIWTVFGLLGLSVLIVGSVVWFRRRRR